MSKKFFKVKNGLHVKPSDPSTITDPEVGDIIVDSQDDNKVKVYQDGEFSTISGSGGTVANFFADFDKLTPTVSNASVADDSVTFLPIDDNKKSKKATFSAAGSVLYEVASEADLEGNQGLMTVWIKTSLNSVTVSTTTDGAVQSTLSVLGTNKWKQYEIPFVVGGTDQGLIVEAGEAGDVFIDEPFVGLAPAGYTSKIATTITDFTDYTPTIVGLGSGTATGIEGSWSRVGDKMILNVAFNIDVTGTGTGNVGFTIPNGFEIDVNKLTYDSGNVSTVGSVFFNGWSTLNASISIKSLPSNIYTSVIASSATSGRRFSIQATVPIVGWSTDYSTVVTQNTELTAQTANELTARIAENGSIISDNYDFLSNCSESSTSPYAITCNFSPNLFSVIPSCTASVLSGANVTVQHTAKIEQLSTSSIELRRNANDDVPSQVLGIELHCSKQGADVNKSATIVGKFENINSDDLCKVEAQSSSGTFELTNNTVKNIIYENELVDNCAAYNSSTGIFTATKAGYYLINGSITASLSLGDNKNFVIRSLVNGSLSKNVVFEGEATTTKKHTMEFTDQVYLNVGQTLNIAGFQNSGSNVFLSSAASENRLSITELPDTQSIVKNLLAESSQTKCQTKFLSGSVINNVSDIADLKFNNLEIGKKYSIEVRANITAVNDNIAYIEFRNNNSLVAIAGSGNSSGTTNSIFTATGDFTASATEVISSSLSIGGSSSIFGNGLKDSTHVRLCQLSDTVVDTEEF